MKPWLEHAKLREALPYILGGVGIGFFLIIIGYCGEEWSGHKNIVTVMFEHLGVGFIVAAISVGFYESTPHFRTMDGLIEKIGRTVEDIHVLQVGEANDALKKSLMVLLEGSDRTRDAGPALLSLVNTIRALNTGSWEQDPFIRVCLRVLFDLTRNMDDFNNISQHAEAHLILQPSVAIMADEVLSGLMNSLSDGDIYCAVSDFSSWQAGQLSHFREATRNAVRDRRVVVRRIFMALEGRDDLGFAESEKIVSLHAQDALDWSGNGAGYEARIFGEQELGTITDSGLRRDCRRVGHFGIFRRNNESIRLQIRKPDLSDLSLSKDKSAIEKERIIFDAMWSVARRIKDKF